MNCMRGCYNRRFESPLVPSAIVLQLFSRVLYSLSHSLIDFNFCILFFIFFSTSVRVLRERWKRWKIRSNFESSSLESRVCDIHIELMIFYDILWNISTNIMVDIQNSGMDTTEFAVFFHQERTRSDEMGSKVGVWDTSIIIPAFSWVQHPDPYTVWMRKNERKFQT